MPAQNSMVTQPFDEGGGNEMMQQKTKSIRNKRPRKNVELTTVPTLTPLRLPIVYSCNTVTYLCSKVSKGHFNSSLLHMLCGATCKGWAVRS